MRCSVEVSLFKSSVSFLSFTPEWGGGISRLPQFTGIFLAVFGQLIHRPTIPTVVLFSVIVWATYRLSKKEEQRMTEQFGSAYETYRQSVPMFFPKRGEWKKLISTSKFREGEQES